jgi:hypothetical protein
MDGAAPDSWSSFGISYRVEHYSTSNLTTCVSLHRSIGRSFLSEHHALSDIAIDR